MSASVANSAESFTTPKQSLLRRITSNYIFRKLVKAMITAWAVITFTFFLIRLLPGNPIEQYVNQLVVTYGTPYNEAYDQAAALFAIDFTRPVWLQYLDYLGNLAHGDLGNSILSPGTPVADIIKRFLPWTIFSVGTGLILAFTIGVTIGLLSAFKRDTWFDHLTSFAASLMSSIPNYLVAIIFIVIFGVRLEWLPIAKMRGTLSPGVKPALSWVFIKDAFFHAWVPIFIYVITSVGNWILTMKSSTTAVLEEDYVTIGRAKGLKDGRILTAYVGRNASLPIFTQLAIAIGFVMGGSVLIETIFQYRGVGATLLQSVQRRDYTLMQGVFLMLTFSVIFANLFADILYSVIDPRIRLED
ncbi:MAG TPA: ABC transporter permease [Anaerolineae bacterium]|nr:ABC transporter permease [Anaerolineae bacterium]